MGCGSSDNSLALKSDRKLLSQAGGDFLAGMPHQRKGCGGTFRQWKSHKNSEKACFSRKEKWKHSQGLQGGKDSHAGTRAGEGWTFRCPRIPDASSIPSAIQVVRLVWVGLGFSFPTPWYTKQFCVCAKHSLLHWKYTCHFLFLNEKLFIRSFTLGEANKLCPQKMSSSQIW